jgi:hypothetical protein
MKYKKYIIDEYIENFKYDKFYSGFIEINAVSIILNKVIVILDNINFNNYWRDYSILAMFNKTEKEISILMRFCILIMFQKIIIKF